MAGFCLNYFTILSALAVPFFIILALMSFFKSEALKITDDNKWNVTISLGSNAIVNYLIYI
jgi:hypothetical protein